MPKISSTEIWWYSVFISKLHLENINIRHWYFKVIVRIDKNNWQIFYRVINNVVGIKSKWKKKLFKADQLIKIKFYCNRWRMCGAHLLPLWWCLWAANQDFAFVFTYCASLFSLLRLFGTRYIERPMCSVCVCECLFLVFAEWSCRSSCGGWRIWQYTVNDDVCKGNFDGSEKKAQTHEVKWAIDREEKTKKGGGHSSKWLWEWEINSLISWMFFFLSCSCICAAFTHHTFLSACLCFCTLSLLQFYDLSYVHFVVFVVGFHFKGFFFFFGFFFSLAYFFLFCFFSHFFLSFRFLSRNASE